MHHQEIANVLQDGVFLHGLARVMYFWSCWLLCCRRCRFIVSNA